MISVEELMSTGVLTVRDTQTLGEADTLMRTAGIRHLPVSDARNHMVGLISNRDVSAAGPRGKGKRVGAVMTREVKTVRPHEPAYRAAELMLEQKFGSLPVIAEDESIVGIITETDFLQVAWQALRQGQSRGTNHVQPSQRI